MWQFVEGANPKAKRKGVQPLKPADRWLPTMKKKSQKKQQQKNKKDIPGPLEKR